MKVWIVITPEGRQKVWLGNWRNRVTHKFPQVDKNGFVFLDNGRPYVVDQKRFTREYYRPMKYLGLIEKEDMYQYWLQNEPDPVSFDKELIPGSVRITSDTIKQYANSEHLNRLVRQDTNWYAIIAILAVIGLIGSIAAWYFRGT